MELHAEGADNCRRSYAVHSEGSPCSGPVPGDPHRLSAARSDSATSNWPVTDDCVVRSKTGGRIGANRSLARYRLVGSAHRALYYPYVTINGPDFWFECLMYWDKLATILPFEGFAAWHGSDELGKELAALN